MKLQAQADNTTDYTTIVGLVMLAIALIFVWRSFYSMRIPDKDDKPATV
jgi:K(+)-stimulated pyrophosphate-energized sodium pump